MNALTLFNWDSTLDSSCSFFKRILAYSCFRFELNQVSLAYSVHREAIKTARGRGKHLRISRFERSKTWAATRDNRLIDGPLLIRSTSDSINGVSVSPPVSSRESNNTRILSAFFANNRSFFASDERVRFIIVMSQIEPRDATDSHPWR